MEMKSLKMKKVLKIILPILVICTISVFCTTQNSQGAPAVDDNQQLEARPLKMSSVDLENLKSDKLPLILDFGADSCVPCKAMAPVLVKLNGELQGKAIIGFVDVWKNRSAAKGFPVRVIPTQVFFTADGKPYVPSENVAGKIKFSSYSDKNTDEHTFTVHEGGLTEEEMRLILADMGVAL